MKIMKENKHQGPQVAVDAIIYQNGKVLLVQRKDEPFKGLWALPGGFVEYGETCEEAVAREALEETGCQIQPLGIFGVYSDPKRDPRGPVVSIVYEAEKRRGRVRADSDALNAGWFLLSKLPPMAFDHRKILSDFLKFLKGF